MKRKLEILILQYKETEEMIEVEEVVEDEE